jgi:hypothetical protein
MEEAEVFDLVMLAMVAMDFLVVEEVLRILLDPTALAVQEPYFII